MTEKNGCLNVLAAGASLSAAFPSKTCRRLYERACSEQWDLIRDIDWEDLPLERIGAAQRQAMGLVYSQLYYGEVLSLAVTTDALSRCPELWVKLFGATQVFDEARHVNFFAAVSARLGDRAAPSTTMTAFAESLAGASTLEELVLGTQVLLEGFAQTIFLEGSKRMPREEDRRIDLPGSEAARRLLHYVEHYVAKDEARHVAFGVLFLRDRVAAAPPAQRRRLTDKAYSWMELLSGQIDQLATPLRMLGVAPQALKGKVQRTHTMLLEKVGLGVNAL